MLDTLKLAGLVPVIKVKRAEDAVPLCRALAEGGLPVAEITFRTDAAEEAIRRVHDELPEVILGAGTVLTTEQVDRAVAAGASYIVSPGINPQVVRHCQEKGVPVLPGCANPTDIETALSLGLETVKFFPAEALGGLKMIKALAGPYPNVRFVPTGGVNEKNLVEYLSFPKIAACGGSWMAPDDAIAAQDWPRICALASAAVKNLLNMKLAHVAVNCADDEEARDVANLLCAILGGAPEERTKSFFATPSFEIMKYNGRGTKGHIAISTPNLERAIWHMRRRGFEFDFSNATYTADGRAKLVYFAKEIGGFAVHLLLAE